jgi:pyruvate,orthophosphate dikinase
MREQLPEERATSEGEESEALDPELLERTELQELLLGIRRADDLRSLHGQLERLEALLTLRFRRESAGVAPDDPPPATADAPLPDDRLAVLATLRDLERRVAAGNDAPVAVVRGELEAFLALLERHGMDGSRAGEDAPCAQGAAPAPPTTVALQALTANLQRTALEVVIPQDQMLLLEMTESLHGVHDATERLLREINHLYIGWPQTIEELHRRAMSDLAYYLAHDRAGDAIDVFTSLYARAAEEASPPELRETAIRSFLSYLAKAMAECGASFRRVAPAIERALASVGALIEGTPELSAAASSGMRRLLDTTLERDPALAQPVQERCLDLLVSTLRCVYGRWLALEDPQEWWREQMPAGSAEAPPVRVAAISHARIAECLHTLVEGQWPSFEQHAEAVLALPDDAAIQRGYLDAASSLGRGDAAWENLNERIRWLIRVLAQPSLKGVHERALGEISRAFVDVLHEADNVGLAELLHGTFAALRRSQLSRSPTAFYLIERIGTEVLASGNPEWVRLLIDELLGWDFPGPRFGGFTDDWQARVDPSHVRAIRTYITLIASNPERARPLIAALVAHLGLGGIFIADTDLFQKDISRLLNAKIAPAYHPIKHLLKLFPAYFNDIGAEGELRDASSQIDEVGGRRDPLCHFLRKQCHVDCNPFLIDFIEASAQFFATGDRSPLERYAPPSLYDELDIDREEWEGLHRIFKRLTADEPLSALFALDSAELAQRLAQIEGVSDVDREKTTLLIRLRSLIGSKYELRHDDALERLGALRSIKPHEVEALRAALASERHEEALAILLTALERLEATILQPEKTEGFEDIYREPHNAVGIPNIYGRYREEKFDAMGLSLRLEPLANALFDRLIAEQDFEFVTRSTLEQVVQWLHLMLRAVRVDGCRGRGLANGLAMLEESMRSQGVSVDQYINIFQLLARGLEQLIRIRFLDLYEPVLERVLPNLLERGLLRPEPGDDRRETLLKVSEEVLRKLISQSLALRQIDALVGRVLRTLLQAREKLDAGTLSMLMSYDGDRACIPIDRRKGPLEGVVHLGNKGYLIKRLARDGFPVPPGFVLTTEVFRCREAIRASAALQRDTAERIRAEITRLEQETGCRLGDPERPLLVSVRTGSAISMPGILDTILNVGMNEEVTEGFAVSSGSTWGAWDAYRRLLQFWGMGHGLERDRFDALMREAKEQHGVSKKSNLEANDMRELALGYREFLRAEGAPIIDDPFEQILACVNLVMDSWSSERSSLYRRELHIAEEWGTAVIVQSMVYGNLHGRAGAGVALTCDPRRPAPGVRLYGDFTTQAQGDDVISGLVETFPISEDQSRSGAKAADFSLQKNFPRIYQALAQHARALIYDHGMFHQEIEFTFESDDPADLYLLQTRDMALSQHTDLPAFVPTDALERARVAMGIGAGGGALSGRCAHTDEDISELSKQHPEDPVILLRPDTVPDDLPLILRVAGMVTVLGGATSHAALAAQRLGRVCVVGCRQLEVDERRGRSLLAGRPLETGQWISIDGGDGSIYLGEHPTKLGRQEGGSARLEAIG